MITQSGGRACSEWTATGTAWIAGTTTNGFTGSEDLRRPRRCAGSRDDDV